MTVRVKICGLTNLADARDALAAGADFLGFILHPPSPRYVGEEALAALIEQLPPHEARTVGVFVDRSAGDVLRVLERCRLDIAQLHGDESDADIDAIGRPRTWKTVWLRGEADVAAAAAHRASCLLADSAVGTQRGGTGTVGRWDLAAELAANRRIVLAGGLTPDNVAEAVRLVRPFAVDVGSGVEQSPGLKDHAKLHQFVAHAKRP